MRTFFLLLALCVCTAATQDPAAVNPKIVKVEFENDQVRILRVHYEPHERLEMHSHPAKAEVRFRDPGLDRVAADPKERLSENSVIARVTIAGGAKPLPYSTCIATQS